MRENSVTTGDRARPRTGARRELQKTRFSAYFPRVFAYACSTARDEAAARDIVVEAFAEVFSMPDMREDEFETELFQAARRTAAGRTVRARGHADGLSSREREVVSLVFDAQLDRAQISALLGVREEAVLATLLRGLRKLQRLAPAGDAGAGVPSLT